MRLGCEWRHARKRWAGILGDFEKKQLVEIWSWTRRDQLGLRDAPRVCCVSELRSNAGRSELIFGPGRGQFSCVLRDVRAFVGQMKLSA